MRFHDLSYGKSEKMSPKSQGPIARGPPLIPRALSESVTEAESILNAGVVAPDKGGFITQTPVSLAA